MQHQMASVEKAPKGIWQMGLLMWEGSGITFDEFRDKYIPVEERASDGTMISSMSRVVASMDYLLTMLNRAEPSASLCFRNGEFVVGLQQVTYRFIYVLVNRCDRGTISWPELQEIKNQLVGQDRWAFQLFPAEGEKIDMVNTYHLFVYPKGRKPKVGRLPKDTSVHEVRVLHLKDKAQADNADAPSGQSRDD